MITPNQITVTRILLIPLFLYFLLASMLPGSKFIAAVFFVLLASSDALDGFIARKYKKTTDLGKLLDPLADKILVYGAFLAFIEMGTLSSIPVLIIISRDLAVMGLRTWVAKSGQILPADTLGKWKTASQMLAIFLLILDWPLKYLVFWLSVILAVLSGWDYFKDLKLEEI